MTFRILCTFLTDMHISIFYLCMLICSTFFRLRTRLRRTGVSRAVKRTVTSMTCTTKARRWLAESSPGAPFFWLARCTFFCPILLWLCCSILEMSRWLDVCCSTPLQHFCYLTMMWFSFSRWQDGLLAAALHDFESQNLDASKVVLV